MRLLPILLCVLVAGCHFAGDDESLEARLRMQDDQIRELQDRVAQAEREALTARKESGVLRASLEVPNSVPRHEQLAAGFAVKELEIVSLLSGVMDDGRIHVVIRPIDEDGDIVKLPGRIEVRLLNLSSDSVQDQRLGEWSWTEAESRSLWNSAAIGAGYALDLPATPLPPDQVVTIRARFIASDDRRFDATHELQSNPAGS